MQLHIFVFDDEFKSLRGLGTPIDLMPFYNQGVSITHACFVHGSEEILFIDSSAQARIFSLTTLQPRYTRSSASTFLFHADAFVIDPLPYDCRRCHERYILPQTGHALSLFKMMKTAIL